MLVRETRGLLIGESAAPHVVESIRAIAREDAKVHAVRRLLTMHLGPGEVLVNIDLELAEDLRSVDVHATIADFERTVRKRHPNVRLIFIETDVARAPEP